MRIKTFTAILIAAFLIFGFAMIETDYVEVDGLKVNGKVKAYNITEISAWDSLGERPWQESRTYEYRFDLNGNQIGEYSWIGDKYQGKVLSFFDKKGNMTAIKNFNSKDSLINIGLVRKYNSTGNVIEELFYENDGSLVEKSSFKYDTNQNLIEKVFFSNSITWHGRYGECCSGPTYDNIDSVSLSYIYKYDEQNHLIEKKTLDAHKEIVETSTWNFGANGLDYLKEVYDSTGLLISKDAEEFYEDGALKKNITYWLDSLETRGEWHYNKNKKLNKINNVTPRKETLFVEKKFDLNGNPIKSYYYRSDTLDRVDVVKYKYDSHNNWIEKVENSGGDSYSIYKVNIEYFD